jgi:hypothetical protein
LEFMEGANVLAEEAPENFNSIYAERRAKG